MVYAFWIIFSVILYAYIGYPLILLIINLFIPKRKDTPFELPKVCMVTAAYNEEHVIEQKIKNALEIDYPKEKIELCFCSDGSTDATAQIINNYASKGLIREVVFERNKGKISILNSVVPRLDCDIVVFSDAASMIKADALRLLVCRLCHEKTGSVSGSYRVANEENSKLGSEEGFYWKYESWMKSMEGRLGIAVGSHGSLYAIKKNLYPCPPADTINDDYAISAMIARKGYRAEYEAEAAAFEDASEMQGFSRKLRIAVGNFQQLRMVKDFIMPFRPLVLWHIVSHKLLRLAVPFLLIVLFFNSFFIGSGIYLAAAFVQLAFYLAAFTGWLAVRYDFKIPVVKVAYYFCMTNISILCGFFVLFFKRNIIWNKRRESVLERDSVKKFFSEGAVRFDSIYTGKKSRFSGFLDKVFRRDMYERFDLTLNECSPLSGKKIIDIGCGSGRYGVALAKNGAGSILGVDFAENMLDIARQLARKEGVDKACEFKAGDFLSMDFPAKFDIALAVGFFDYIRQATPFIKKICSVSNETVIATFPRKWTWRAPLRKVRLALKKCPVYFYEKNDIRRLFENSGFTIKKMERVGNIYFVRADKAREGQ